MSDRPISSQESAQLRAVGFGNMRDASHEHILGVDGLLVLTSPQNAAISISVDDLAGVFSGRIRNWSDLGLLPGRITVYAPSRTSGAWDTFDKLILQPRGLTLVSSARRSPDNSELSDLVAADPNGIGITGFAYQRSAKPLNIEQACGLITPPSSFAVKTEEYPLKRRLYLYTPGRVDHPLGAALVDFALSAEAQDAVRKSDFVDQKPELISFSDQGSRVAYALNAPQEDFDLDLMRTFLMDLKGARRLSITFRFRPGSFALDAKSLQDVRRLSRVLTDGALRSSSVKLIGFADSAGSFRTNLRLSAARAGAVQTALSKASGGRILPTRVAVRAYGELAPVACNDSAEGKSFNRRVEVWLDAGQSN